MSKCRIYDDDIRACSAHYKSINEKKGKNQYHGKPYNSPTDRGKKTPSNERKPSGGDTLTYVKCFKCGELGHNVNVCRNNVLMCLKCGKTTHCVEDCKSIR